MVDRQAVTRRIFIASTALALPIAATGQRAARQKYREARAPIADRVRDLLGRMTLEEKAAQMRSTAWCLSNVFEEVNFPNFILKEGDGGWGMQAQRNIARLSFNIHKLLHRLGQKRLAASGPAPLCCICRQKGCP